MYTMRNTQASKLILGWVATAAILATTPAPPAGGVEQAQGELAKRDQLDLREQVLSFGPGASNLLFVPESKLADTSLETAPVSDTERQYLRSVVEKFRDPRWGSRCQPNRSEPPVQGSAEDTRTFEDVLRDQEIVFVGTIVEIVPGWSCWTGQVARMAYVEVQEILRIAEHEPGVTPGRVLGILFKGGSTRIAGTQICEEVRPGFYQPVLGDQVVVGGKVLEADENFFYRRVLFPVLGGEILAQPYTDLAKDEIALDLRRLGRRLEATREQR